MSQIYAPVLLYVPTKMKHGRRRSDTRIDNSNGFVRALGSSSKGIAQNGTMLARIAAERNGRDIITVLLLLLFQDNFGKCVPKTKCYKGRERRNAALVVTNGFGGLTNPSEARMVHKATSNVGSLRRQLLNVSQNGLERRRTVVVVALRGEIAKNKGIR